MSDVAFPDHGRTGWFDPYSEQMFEDPFPTYSKLRDNEPAYYAPEFDCFFLSRFQDVHDACRNTAFTHASGTTPDTLLLGREVPVRALSSLTHREHLTLRSTLSGDFFPAAARRMEEQTRQTVSQWLDEAMERGTLDVQADLAGRLAVHVALSMAGLPVEDAEWVAARVRDAFDRVPGVRGQTPTARQAAVELNAYAADAIADRRRNPREGGVIAKLLSYEYEGRPMPDEEVIANLFLLIIGGSETMPKVFAGLIAQLAEHPDQRAAVAADPGLADDAVWEALRTEMPTLMLGATAEKNTVICGDTHVRAGQKIMHLWAAANRDEREFADPDRFDIRRKAPRIISFNPGRHICLGMHIAQMEGRVLLRELLARSPEYEVDLANAKRVRSEMFRGFAELPIRF